MYFRNLTVQSISADIDRGGWQANLTEVNDDALADYGTQVILYTLAEGGGVWEENNHKAMIGYITPQTTIFNKQSSSTNLLLRTSDMFLQSAGLQGIYFTDGSGNPHQIPGLNLGLIVKHILVGHTNLAIESGGWVDLEGIDIINSSQVNVYTVRQSNSIWSTLENIASNEFYVRYFTRNDKFIYKPHPQFAETPSDIILELTASNIIGQPEITYRNDVKVSQVQLYALTDDGNILESFYPLAVGTEAGRQKFANLRCNSQIRLALLASRAYYHVNRDIDVRVSIMGAWGLYIELYDRISITYSGTVINGVSVVWNSKIFYVKSINVQRVGTRNAITELVLEEEFL